MDGLAQIHGRDSSVHPTQSQPEPIKIFHAGDTNCFGIAHLDSLPSSSEYICHRARISALFLLAQSSASAVSRGSALPARTAVVSITTTMRSLLRVMTWK